MTSLPELVSGVSSIQIAGAPDLAVGDILGSCLFNLTLVFFLDALFRKQSVYSMAGKSNLLSAALSIISAGYVGFGLILAQNGITISIGHVGLYTLLIPVLYFLSVRTIYQFEKAAQGSVPSKRISGTKKLAKPVLGYLISAIVVIIAALALPVLGQKIVVAMNWNQAFMGTLFIAFATSLPEFAITLASARLGTIELALANLLGSNLFNFVVLTIDDAVLFSGPLFRHVSSVHIVTVCSLIMMTGLILVGLIDHPRKRVFNAVSVMSLLLFAIYVLNSYAIFHLGG